MVHCHASFLECVLLKRINLKLPLIPLEGVKALIHLRNEATLHVIVHSKVPFYQISKLRYYLIGILLDEPLESSEGLEFVEILFELGI
jgi:hypothetical protein